MLVDLLPLRDTHWLTFTPALFEGEGETTIWGLTALLMIKRDLNQQLVDKYLLTMLEAELSVFDEYDVPLRRSDNSLISTDQHMELFKSADLHDTLIDPDNGLFISRSDAETLWHRLEVKRGEVLDDMSIPFLLHYLLLEEISRESTTIRFRDLIESVGDGKALTFPTIPVIDKKTALNPDTFMRGLLGSALTRVIEKRKYIKKNDISAEYKLIGILAHILKELIPDSFRFANKEANVSALADFILENVKSYPKFIKKRKLTEILDEGLMQKHHFVGLQDDLKIQHRGRFKTLRKEGVDLEGFLKKEDW